MLSFQNQSDVRTLVFGDRQIFSHSPEHPFAIAIKREKTYEADRGTVKETVTEVARVPLVDFAEKDGAFTLSAKGHSLSVALTEQPDGVQLDFTGEEGWAYEFTLPAIEGEAVFGGGEQYRQTNLRGETVVNFVSEHIKAKTVIEKALLPRFLYREKPHAAIGSYAPMPVFMTDSGRLFLFDTTADGKSTFGADAYTFTFDACPGSILVCFGSSFDALAKKLAERVENRQYLPDWCFDGMILGIQGGTQTILEKTFAMLDAGAKISGVWSQDWSGENRTVMGKQVWWNWEADETLYPDLKGAIKKLNERGVRFLAYINPYLVKDSRLYTECKEKGFLITRTDGSIYHIKSTTFDAGMLDLTNPEAVRYVKDVLIKKNMLDLGVSGWMADFGEYLPVDAVLYSGEDPYVIHNQWPAIWSKLNREAIVESGKEGEVFFFTRAGHTGTIDASTMMWTGDQHVDWSVDDGLISVVPATLSLAMSGYGITHSDAGGYTTYGKLLSRSKELLMRWMEMDVFTPLLRTHEGNQPVNDVQWYDDEELLAHTAKCSRMHAALKPYLMELSAETQAHGTPVMRPLFYHYDEDRAYTEKTEYLLGPDILVAPIYREKADFRAVYLPEDTWVHLFTGEEYHGGTEEIESRIGEPPVFVRKESKLYNELMAVAKA